MFRSTLGTAIRRYSVSAGSKPAWHGAKLMAEKKDVKVYEMTREHLPLIVPLFKEFLLDETLSAGFDLPADDAFAWPYLFNCTRYPVSQFAVIGDRVAGFSVSDIVFRDDSMDPVLSAPLPEYPPEHPFQNMYSILDWMTTTVFKLKPEPQYDKMLCMDITYVAKEFRNTDVGKLVASVPLYNPNYQAYLNSMGISGMHCFCSSKISQAYFLKQRRATLLDQLDDSYYRMADGRMALPRDADANAMLFFWDYNLPRDFSETSKI